MGASRAVPAVLAAYNWAPNTDRYSKIAQFVDAFFTKFPTLKSAIPSEMDGGFAVSSACRLNRLPAAQQWLDSHGIQPIVRQNSTSF